MRQKLIIRSEVIRSRVLDLVKSLPLEPCFEITVAEFKSKRSLEQNAKMWAMLHDISVQVNWHGQKLTEAEWKDVFTSALKRQKVVPGIDGGFVVIGAHTSKMSSADMSELIEFAMAFGCQHDVKWSDHAHEF